MPDIQTAVQGLQSGADMLFLLTGAVLVFAMHGGFAFLEAGTVRHKNQVNALCKILVDFAISTVAYFFIGYTIAYGVTFFVSAQGLQRRRAGLRPQGLTLVKFFFLCTFAAAVPAIISGGIAERARFLPAVRGHGVDRRPVLSVLRRHRLEQELRPAGDLLQGQARRGVP